MRNDCVRWARRRNALKWPGIVPVLTKKSGSTFQNFASSATVGASSRTDVGGLMLSYGGGGHEAAGTCQVENAEAQRVLAELIERVNADG